MVAFCCGKETVTTVPIQSICQSRITWPIFVDSANNFFSIYGDFGDLLEKSKSHMLYKLIKLASRGPQEFINYLGSIFLVKALGIPPYHLPNKVCFHPKMVCFLCPSFEEISGW